MGGFTTLSGAYTAVDNALAQFEGFGTPNAPTITNANNPGAIVPGSFATQMGAIGATTTAGGQPVAVFPDASTGFAAVDALVSNYANGGATIQDLINAWSPPTAPGNSATATQNYINAVSSKLGVSPNTPLTQLQNQTPATNAVTPPATTTTNTSGVLSPGCLLTGVGCTPGSSLSDQLNGALGLPNSTSGTGTSSGSTWGRIGFFLLGLILIAGGIYLFKPVSGAVSTVARTGRHAVEGLAVAS